jgi:hypothetical protein
MVPLTGNPADSRSALKQLDYSRPGIRLVSGLEQRRQDVLYGRVKAMRHQFGTAVPFAGKLPETRGAVFQTGVTKK